MNEPLDIRVSGGVATLTLNRPQAFNAIDAALREALHSAVRRLADDDAVQVLIVTGAGGNFCSGGDVKTMGTMTDAAQGRERVLALQPLVRALLGLEKPLIAAVEGVAFGAGLGLALTADFLVAAQGARFCCSFGRVGLVPDFAAAFTLPRIVGLRRAKELVLSACEFDAAQASQWGMASEVTAQGGALQRAEELAALLVQGSPMAFALAKRMLTASQHSDTEHMLSMEVECQGAAFASDWHAQAAQAFRARQPPRFRWPRDTGD